jgi:hypothetical protein
VEKLIRKKSLWSWLQSTLFARRLIKIFIVFRFPLLSLPQITVFHQCRTIHSRHFFVKLNSSEFNCLLVVSIDEKFLIFINLLLLFTFLHFIHLLWSEKLKVNFFYPLIRHHLSREDRLKLNHVTTSINLSSIITFMHLTKSWSLHLFINMAETQHSLWLVEIFRHAHWKALKKRDETVENEYNSWVYLCLEHRRSKSRFR